MYSSKSCGIGIKQKSLAQEYGTDIQYAAFKMLKKGPQLLWN
jgi:hypothetical protein